MENTTLKNRVLEEIFRTHKTFDKDNNERIVNDMISSAESHILYKTFIKAKAKKTIEVGLAHGVSALVICQAHFDANNKSDSNSDILHYAVDPNQLSYFNNAALTALDKAGFNEYYKVLEGPSHLQLPSLIESGIQFELAFIDGWHTFDYTLIDFFLIDKMLHPGSYVVFHDGYGRSKQKVFKYILTHRKYEIDKELMKFRDDNFITVMKMFIWRMFKDPMIIFSKFHWKYQFFHNSGLYIFKKIENFEPDYTFYKSF